MCAAVCAVHQICTRTRYSRKKNRIRMFWHHNISHQPTCAQHTFLIHTHIHVPMSKHKFQLEHMTLAYIFHFLFI